MGRTRSFSLNAYLAGSATTSPRLQRREGMTGYTIYTKESQMIAPPPSQLWVFVEENADTIDDGWMITKMNDMDVRDNLPASYHNGACNFSFADGHTELHKWKSSKTCHAVYYVTAIPITDVDSPDIQWMPQHTTAPLP